MATLFLLAALAVTGLGAWINRRSRGAGLALLGLGGLGLLAVIAVQVRQNVFPPEPKTPNRSAMAISFGLASSLLGDVAGQSGTVVLLFPPRRLMDEDAERSYEEGFVLHLRHGGAGLHLKAVRLEGADRDGRNGLAALKQALAQAEQPLAIVSYAGTPAGFDSLFDAGQPNIAPFYVFDPDRTTNWLGPLKAGRIRAVVLPRPGADSGARQAAAGPPEAIFEQCYLVAKLANADQVAASLSAGRASH